MVIHRLRIVFVQMIEFELLLEMFVVVLLIPRKCSEVIYVCVSVCLYRPISCSVN